MLLSTIRVLTFLTSYFCRDCLFIASSDQGDIVNTGYAKYLGNRSYANAVAYLGIPYAEPPIGDLRFRAPLPLNKTRVALATGGKVVDSTKYPDFCVQGFAGAGTGSEDCLNVNIYAPVGANPSSKLPVLVYIHGGGYFGGDPASWPFDHWIHQSPNVVIASIYYRLSSFGFLASPAFRDSTIGDLNAGFLDQIEALRWVKGNIASFGGNPSQITINGQSAGGNSIELHLVAKNVERLFHRAIAQSVYRTPLPTPEQQQPLFDFYTNYAGCGTGSVQNKLACLRQASVSTLTRAQHAAGTSVFTPNCSTASGYNSFRPVIDGNILLDFPTRSILAGNFTKVPLIVGATTNETVSLGSDIATALQTFFPSILDADIEALIAAYPLSAFVSANLQLQTLTGDVTFRCAREIMGKEFSKTASSWVYRYDQKVPTSEGSGVWHSAENWMMFKGINTRANESFPMTPTEDAFAAELIAYWLSFVISGDPSQHRLTRSPVWPPYKNNSRIVLQQGPGTTTTVSGSFIETESETDKTRCELVGSQTGRQQN